MNFRNFISAAAMMAASIYYSSLLYAADEAGLRSLVFLADQDYPPMTYLENGIAKGMDIDFGKAMAERMNREMRIELMDWSRAQEMVRDGQADGLLGMSISTERKRLFDFSISTFEREFGLLVRRDNVAIRNTTDLEGHSVGVTSGGFPRQFMKSQQNVRVVLIDNYEDGFKRLINGDVDAIAADLWVAAHMMEDRGIHNVIIAGKPFATAPAAVAVKKGNTDLLKEINEAISAMKSDGTVAYIKEKWQPQEILFVSRERVRRLAIITTTAFVSVLFGAMGVWIYILKKQMRIRRQAEAALRESEERYQLAVQGSSDGLWDWNVRTNEVFHSNRLREILGYGPDEFPNAFHSFESHLHPDDKERVLKALASHLEHRTPYDAEYRLQTKSGNYGWYRARGQAIWNEEGKAIRMAGSITDITKQKQGEQLLRESEERLRAVIEKTPNVAIQLYDKTGRVLFWNQASQVMYGWSAADAVGKTLDQLIHTKEEWEQFVALLKTIGDTGQPVGPSEFHIRRRDGSDGYCLATLFSIPASGGELSFVCMDVDLTDLKKADAALRASETRLRTLADASFEGVAVCEDGILVDVNDQIIDILGYENRTEMIGKPVVDLIAPESRELVRSMIESGRTEPYEHLALRKNGSVLPVEVCGRTISKKPHHVRVTTVRDMTARKQAEQALHESETRRLEALQREQQSLEFFTRRLIESQESERRRIAGELHDSLGQNLLLLKNRAQMALSVEKIPDVLNEQLEGIRSVATQAIAEVRHIAYALHPYQLDHLGLARAIEAMIENAAQSTGIVFERKLDDVEKIFSRESATNIYRIVQESVNNIVKHAQATRVWVELERDVRDVRLMVKDNGRGFHLEHYFHNGSSEGFGLKNIAERVRILNGTLNITTAPAAGSTIEVVIPVSGEL